MLSNSRMYIYKIENLFDPSIFGGIFIFANIIFKDSNPVKILYAKILDPIPRLPSARINVNGINSRQPLFALKTRLFATHISLKTVRYATLD